MTETEKEPYRSEKISYMCLCDMSNGLVLLGRRLLRNPSLEQEFQQEAEKIHKEWLDLHTRIIKNYGDPPNDPIIAEFWEDVKEAVDNFEKAKK